MDRTCGHAVANAEQRGRRLILLQQAGGHAVSIVHLPPGAKDAGAYAVGIQLSPETRLALTVGLGAVPTGQHHDASMARLQQPTSRASRAPAVVDRKSTRLNSSHVA